VLSGSGRLVGHTAHLERFGKLSQRRASCAPNALQTGYRRRLRSAPRRIFGAWRRAVRALGRLRTWRVRAALLSALGLLCAPLCARAQPAADVSTSANGIAKLKHFDDSKAGGGAHRAAPKKVDDRGLVLLPVIVSDPLLGVGLGVAGIYSFQLGAEEDTRGSYLSTSALVTTNKQIKFALTHNVDFPHDAFVLRGRVLFKIFSEDYWGVGNNTPDSQQRKLSYNSIDYLGRINIATKFENWFVGPLIRVNFTWDSSLAQPYPPPDLPDDKLQNFFMIGVGLSVAYDTRDGLTNPYHGSYLALELINMPSGIPGVRDTNVGVIAGTIDYRKFWKPFVHRDQVLATRVFGDFTYGQVPSSILPTPGRDDKLRGYLEGRYRDYDLVGVDLEYRVRWWKALGSTVFASWGTLFGAPGDQIRWKTMNKTVGGGLRYMVQDADRLNIRLDIGYNFHGFTAVIFECGEAF
jgi:hypothetical protein